MVKRSLMEQLDQAIDAMLAQSYARTVEVDPSLAPLLRIAAELRDLPRAEFKARLGNELKEAQPMANTAKMAEGRARPSAVSPIPKGYHTVTPYVVVQDAPGLIDFVTQAFGAVEGFRAIGSAGGIHSEVRVGDSMMMIGGGSPELAWRGASIPTSLHLYVEDADAVYRRALAAGAVSVEEPVDQPYGDREAGVRDSGGNLWWIATHQEGGYKPKDFHSVTPYLHPHEAEPMIAFLKKAFGAEEMDRHASPDGVVHHATVRVGDSVIEMGEAHGAFQPMPSMFYLYVADVDALYARAIQAGATSLSAPRDQDYGDRSGGVKDPFGNQWYIATHIKDVAP